jgi:hypothetical protein
MVRHSTVARAIVHKHPFTTYIRIHFSAQMFRPTTPPAVGLRGLLGPARTFDKLSLRSALARATQTTSTWYVVQNSDITK